MKTLAPVNGIGFQCTTKILLFLWQDTQLFSVCSSWELLIILQINVQMGPAARYEVRMQDQAAHYLIQSYHPSSVLAQDGIITGV